MNNQFEFEHFWSMNFQSILNYEILLDYLYDDDALRVFNNKKGYMVFDGELKQLSIDHPYREHWLDVAKDSLLSTIRIMNNQIIVYISTILESSLIDFFQCLFRKEPSKVLALNQFFDDSIADLGFSYSDFLQYNSKDDYIYEIAERAAKKCNSGKLKSILKRIKDISGLQIPESITNEMILLVKLRNEIVHEGISHDLNYDNLKKFSDELENLIRLLALKLYEFKINVVDPGDLLELYDHPEYKV